MTGRSRHDDHLRLAGAGLPAARHDRDRRRLQEAARAHGRLDRHGRDLPCLPGGTGRADLAAKPRAPRPPVRLLAVELREHGRYRRADVDSGRPAVGLHDPGRHGRVDHDPPVLGFLHGRGQRLRALLRLPQLLRLLDAAAGLGRQLPAVDRGLGLCRCRLLPADLLLVPALDRHQSRHQGVRDQRRRRRRAGARHVLPLQAHRHARFPEGVQGRAERLLKRRRRRDRRLPAAARGGVCQVGADPAAHMASRRDGGTHARLRPDPRRHDGDRRRVPDRAYAPLLRTGPGRPGRGRDHRLRDARDRRHDRAHPDRHQARDRLLDDVADRLHDHGRVRRRLRRRHVPPDDPRLLQGAACSWAPARSSARWAASSRSRR